MQRTRKVPQHCAQPGRVSDAARQVANLVPDARELAKNSRRSWAGRRQPASKVLVMLDNVVNLPKRVLARDLGAEAGTGLASVALKACDGGMLVLDLACDRAEWPVGDVPGNSTGGTGGC